MLVKEREKESSRNAILYTVLGPDQDGPEKYPKASYTSNEPWKSERNGIMEWQHCQCAASDINGQ